MSKSKDDIPKVTLYLLKGGGVKRTGINQFKQWDKRKAVSDYENRPKHK